MGNMNIGISGHIRSDTTAEIKTLYEESLGYWPCLSIGEISFHGNRENFERLHALLGRWLAVGGYASDELGAPEMEPDPS